MGPNGSGKSTLAYVLAGREGYEVTAGERPLSRARPARAGARGARARRRVPAFQYPVEIPGVDNVYFLQPALNAMRRAARRRPELDAVEF